MFIEKKYGTVVVGSSFLVTIFCLSSFVVLSFTWTLWFEFDSMLSKLGTGASVVGLFVGTFIAIWLINRDRNKRLEENHNYKEWLLVNLQGVIMAVQQSVFNYGTRRKEDDIIKIINLCKEDFDYWKGQIEKINFNPLVPIKIRSTVTMFFHQGVKPLLNPNMVFLEDGLFLKRTFLDLLDKIIHTSYIHNDKDAEIQRLLKMVDECTDLLKQAAALKPKTHSM
ncbi:MAG: hypothetical protein WD717_06615 [Nitrosarchaeum sp.]